MPVAGRTRRIVVAVVVALWAGGLLALWRSRGATSAGAVPLAERMAAAATRLAPGTYYYTVAQSGTPIGIATSTIERDAAGFRERGAVRARAVIYGDSQTVEAAESARLSRRFGVDSFSFSLGGDQGPLTIRGAPTRHQGFLLVPALAPAALLLSGPKTVGRSADYWVYNPLAQRVERVTLRIDAESLFHVTDSAALHPARQTWLPAHSDTVRAWSVTTPAHSFTAWFDAGGRLVAASEPGGLSLVRTPREIARSQGAVAQTRRGARR